MSDDNQPHVNLDEENQETSNPQGSGDAHATAPRDTIRSVLRPAFAEFLGSAIFIYVACGCGVNASIVFKTPGSQVLAISLCFGLTIFVLAFMIGHISGGHLNPVVSVAFMLMRKISPLRCIMYVLAQFFGTIVGGLFLRATTPDDKYSTGCFAANFVHEGITPGSAFLSEVILTFFLLQVVCAATDANKSNQTLVPLAIGICVTVCHLMSLTLTGTSLNPTRSFASAVVASNVPGCEFVWGSHWVFWLGPFLGGISGAYLYEYVFHDGGSKFQNLIASYRK
jgi:MIP family channel proteins